MESLTYLVCGLLALVNLACWIIVLIRMFQNGATGMAVLSIVLSLCGLGALVAFIYGWTKAGQWNLTNVMLTWTLSLIGGALFGVLGWVIGIQIGV